MLNTFSTLILIYRRLGFFLDLFALFIGASLFFFSVANVRHRLTVIRLLFILFYLGCLILFVLVLCTWRCNAGRYAPGIAWRIAPGIALLCPLSFVLCPLPPPCLSCLVLDRLPGQSWPRWEQVGVFASRLKHFIRLLLFITYYGGKFLLC